jgi:peptidoglycan/LPS O-acetylase OafA/YrhL
MSTWGATATRGRIQSLVGLRGAAALIVVVHHALLRIPVLDDVYANNEPVPDTGSLAWWMVHTPLHLVWAGGEAVFVFFVLSGLVLTLPILRSDKFSWLAYYPARLVRLYVPVWAAIAWALLIFVALSAFSPELGAAWSAERGITVDPIQIAERAVLLHNSNFYNGPLWSIVWEVLFSLLLPLYVVVLVRLRVHWAWKLAASFAVMAAGAYLRDSIPSIGNLLLYMPMFAVGVLMAAHLDELGGWAARIERSRRPKAIWNLLVVLALLALCSYWFVLLATTNIRS